MHSDKDFVWRDEFQRCASHGWLLRPCAATVSYDRTLPNHEVVPQIISEIVELEPRVRAIAAVMVLEDGTLRVRTAFMEETKFVLLAAADLLHAGLRKTIEEEP